MQCFATVGYFWYAGWVSKNEIERSNTKPYETMSILPTCPWVLRQRRLSQTFGWFFGGVLPPEAKFEPGRQVWLDQWGTKGSLRFAKAVLLFSLTSYGYLLHCFFVWFRSACKLVSCLNCRLFIPEAFGDGLIPPAAESDILRLYLLKKYGGVWVDATNLCRRPLDAWLPSAACEGFFAFFPDLQSPEHKGVPHIISSAWAGWIISVYIITLMRPRLSIAFSLTDLTGCWGMLMFWPIHQLQLLHHSAGIIRFHCFLPWASYRFCLAWAHQVTLVQKLPRATWFGIPVGQQALQEIGWTWRWRRSESSEYLGQSAKDKLWAWQEGANAFLALCWFYYVLFDF